MYWHVGAQRHHAECQVENDLKDRRGPTFLGDSL